MMVQKYQLFTTRLSGVSTLEYLYKILQGTYARKNRLREYVTGDHRHYIYFKFNQV